MSSQAAGQSRPSARGNSQLALLASGAGEAFPVQRARRRAVFTRRDLGHLSRTSAALRPDRLRHRIDRGAEGILQEFLQLHAVFVDEIARQKVAENELHLGLQRRRQSPPADRAEQRGVGILARRGVAVGGENVGSVLADHVGEEGIGRGRGWRRWWCRRLLWSRLIEVSSKPLPIEGNWKIE